MTPTVQLTLVQALLGTLVGAAVIFSTRLFPFALFSKKDPPAIIRFIEKYIPSMIMAILVVYCLKDISFTTAPYGMPYYIALAVTIALHLLFKNPMISIFGGTALFMVLSHLM
jgi:branched-subunit amino acid transport protein AzlD